MYGYGRSPQNGYGMDTSQGFMNPQHNQPKQIPSNNNQYHPNGHINPGNAKTLSGFSNGNNGYNSYQDPYSTYMNNNPNPYGQYGYNYNQGIPSFLNSKTVPKTVPQKKYNTKPIQKQPINSNNKLNKDISKGKSNEEISDIILKNDKKVKIDGYDQNINYIGADAFEDAISKEQGYKKGESFVQDGEKSFNKHSMYGGDAKYQQDDVTTDAKVSYIIDHSLKFRNDFEDENHSGSYKGDEFEVKYKASDMEGGFYNNDIERTKKTQGYNGFDTNGEFGNKGKYFGDEYTKYGDDERDIYIKQKGKGVPNGYDPKYEREIYRDYPNTNDDLYSKFKGSNKKGISAFGERSNSRNRDRDPRYFSNDKYIIKDDIEKDDKYKGIGSTFDGHDKFIDKRQTEAYLGRQDTLKDKAAFDRGNYRDVNAKGSNKFASYAGDYNTNKKKHDVDFKVMHNEDLKQDLQQDVASDVYFAKYNGEDTKRAKDAERNFGVYKDAEIARKTDAVKNNKIYNGQDFSNQRNVENEGQIYYGVKKENDNRQRNRFSRPQRYGNRNGYGYRDDYGYYNPYKRRLSNIDGNINLIHMATKIDLLIGVLCMFIICFMTFIIGYFALHYFGYKIIKIKNNNIIQYNDELIIE